MDVAIIGAGLAGLSSAITLEKYGIVPTIYEKADFIGDREQHVAATLNIFDKPIMNVLEYIEKRFGIKITPLNIVKTMTHYSPNKTVSLVGEFGNFLLRDKSPQSIKGQLYSQLNKTEILLNKKADYKKLKNEYDYVIVATGTPNIAEELGCWTNWIHGWIKGADVSSDFDTSEMLIWLNKKYCRNGYAYLTPINSHKASLLLFLPFTAEAEVNSYWELFLKTENIKYKILETFKVRHGSGYVYPHRFGNVFLTGGVGGAIDPFLGFGQTTSIQMGGLLAESIAKGLEFEKMITDLMKKNADLYEFRKAYDKATDKSYDKIVTAIGLPGVKPVIYYSPINVIKIGASAIRLKNTVSSSQLTGEQ
jgi:digeranylgeranylglycerophospholipid reductase